MGERGLNVWRERLQKMLVDLDAEDAMGLDSQAIVELDQQSVGRLSRMDALQQQAMAEAQARRRETQRRRLRAALERIDEGEFGFCVDCGDKIAAKRLDLDPTVPKCLSCAAG